MKEQALLRDNDKKETYVPYYPISKNKDVRLGINRRASDLPNLVCKSHSDPLHLQIAK